MFEVLQRFMIVLLFLRFLEPLSERLQMKKYMRFFAGMLICLSALGMMGQMENENLFSLPKRWQQEMEEGNLSLENGEEKRNHLIQEMEQIKQRETEQTEQKIEIEEISW